MGDPERGEGKEKREPQRVWEVKKVWESERVGGPVTKVWQMHGKGEDQGELEAQRVGVAKNV